MCVWRAEISLSRQVLPGLSRASCCVRDLQRRPKKSFRVKLNHKFQFQKKITRQLMMRAVAPGQCYSPETFPDPRRQKSPPQDGEKTLGCLQAMCCHNAVHNTEQTPTPPPIPNTHTRARAHLTRTHTHRHIVKRKPSCRSGSSASSTPFGTGF